MAEEPPSAEQVARYVGERAPELDPGEVEDFMARHSKPPAGTGESHLEWAVRVMRERRGSEFGEGLPVDRVVDELRRRET